ncbi:MAG: hypothetical protein ACPGMR_11475 [Pontibacterium sp.]
MLNLANAIRHQLKQPSGASLVGYLKETIASALSKRPAEYESVALMIAAAEAGLISVGERVKTVSYHLGLNKGGNAYVLQDAGSAEARPADDDGSVIWVGDAGLYFIALSMDNADQCNGTYLPLLSELKAGRTFELRDAVSSSIYNDILNSSNNDDWSDLINNVFEDAKSLNISDGLWYFGESILVPFGGKLTGNGHENSILRLQDGANLTSAAMRVRDGSHVSSKIVLSNFQLNGNRDTQTTGAGLIDLAHTNSAALARLFLSQLLIINSKEDGLRTGAFTRDSIISNNVIYGSDGVGARITADIIVNGLNVGNSGLQGLIAQNSCSISALKVWESANIDASKAQLEITAPSVKCDAWLQDGAGDGLCINGVGHPSGVESCNLNIISENNGGDAVDIDTANYNRVSVTVRDRNGGFPTHSAGVRYRNGSEGNEVNITSANTTFTYLIDNADADNNITNITKRKRIKEQPYAFTFNPNALETETFKMTLSGGGVSVGAPSGAYKNQKLSFIFVQDATGGRSISFNSVFKTAGTVSTTANSTSYFEFVFDGTSWIQQSFQTGLL